MDNVLSRRGLIGAALALPLLTLPGCAGGFGFGLEEAVRRLLTLSSQRAFARLLEENGFFAHDVARVVLPSQLGGSRPTTLLAALLKQPAVQDRLLRQVNRAASQAAQVAAPIVTQSIRSMTIADALSIVRGGSTAATDYLERQMGNAIFDAMLPEVGEALQLFDNQIVTQALRAATGIDFAGLRQDVAMKASQGIYRAIAQEEAAIRADPSATGDPVLRSVFRVLR
jgi:hypothetical protein